MTQHENLKTTKIQPKLDFNEQQKQVISFYEGAILVEAGPGSGKTRTLTQRIINLINRGVDSDSILAVTFTRKAAAEMTSRISESAELIQRKMIKIGTFHSLCAEFLQSYSSIVSMKPGFRICSNPLPIIKEVLNEIEWPSSIGVTNKAKLKRLRTKRSSKNKVEIKFLGPELIRAISRFKQHSILPATIIHLPKNEMQKHLRKVKYPDFISLYTKYCRRLEILHQYDFDDLLLKCKKMCEKDNFKVSKIISARFKFLLVDEFQDSSPLMLALIRLWAHHGNILVVGDPWQTIFSFNGSDITNMAKFKNLVQSGFRVNDSMSRNSVKKPGKVVNLFMNYRSTKNICSFASFILKSNNTQTTSSSIQTLDSPHPIGDPVTISFHESFSDEVKAISQTILNSCLSSESLDDLLSKSSNSSDQLCSEQSPTTQKSTKPVLPSFGDFVVLIRTNSDSFLWEREFRLRNIPFILFKTRSFTSRVEIKAIVCYLKLINNPLDDFALKYVLNIPARGIGPASLSKLEILKEKHSLSSLFQVLKMISQGQEKITPKRQNLAIRSFCIMIEDIIQWFQKSSQSSVVKLYEKIISKISFKSYLESNFVSSFKERLENLSELEKLIVRLSAESQNSSENEQNLNTSSSTLTFVTQQLESSDVPQSMDTPNAVVISTYHSVKGLEFPFVFLPHVTENKLPHFFSIQDTFVNAIPEELRIFYVGISRAISHLHISSSPTQFKKFNADGEFTYIVNPQSRPSRYLFPLFQEPLRFDHYISNFGSSSDTDDEDDYSIEEEEDTTPTSLNSILVPLNAKQRISASGQRAGLADSVYLPAKISIPSNISSHIQNWRSKVRLKQQLGTPDLSTPSLPMKLDFLPKSDVPSKKKIQVKSRKLNSQHTKFHNSGFAPASTLTKSKNSNISTSLSKTLFRITDTADDDDDIPPFFDFTRGDHDPDDPLDYIPLSKSLRQKRAREAFRATRRFRKKK